MSEIADSKASFEGDLAVKSRKLKMQSTSNVLNLKQKRINWVQENSESHFFNLPLGDPI